MTKYGKSKVTRFKWKSNLSYLTSTFSRLFQDTLEFVDLTLEQTIKNPTLTFIIVKELDHNLLRLVQIVGKKSLKTCYCIMKKSI